MTTTPINSSTIESVDYDKDTQVLTVHFKKGGSYQYPNVRPEMFDQFMQSGSKGQFLHQYLRGNANHPPSKKERGIKK